MTELSSLVASSTMRRLGDRFLPRMASFMSASLFSDLTMVAVGGAKAANTVASPSYS